MQISQSMRLISLSLKLALITSIAFIMDRTEVLSLTDTSLWFYGSMLNALLANDLVTPFYQRPADTIAYSVASILALATAFPAQTQPVWVQLLAVTFISYNALVLVIAFAAVLTKDRESIRMRGVSNSLRITLEYFGHHKTLFSLILIYAVAAFHRSVPSDCAWIAFAWAISVATDPITGFLRYLHRIINIFRGINLTPLPAEVFAHQIPGVILIRPTNEIPAFGSCFLVSDERTKPAIAVCLGLVGRDASTLLKCLIISRLSTEDLKAQSFHLDEKGVFDLPESIRAAYQEEITRAADVIGLVSEGSTIEVLSFELLGDIPLQEGELIQAEIDGKAVIYQVLDAVTAEEIVYSKNTFGFIRVRARKIGHWDAGNRRFRRSPWIPEMYSPVYRTKDLDPADHPDSIGRFPGSNYPVILANINALVTHNTAILGILGVGKTMLSLELVERMLRNGIQVICIDPTNEYRQHLETFSNSDADGEAIQRISEASQAARDEFSDNPQDGGSARTIEMALRTEIQTFADSERELFIINPSEITGTRQIQEPRSYNEGGQWHRVAGLYDLTPVEISQFITEASFDCLASRGMSEQARLCIVFEEAHSLVPEWNTAAQEGDKQATNKTSRAILQGRKFGLGCLLVTQRTANVTKTILNQCNSVFAMRTFDATGTEFLANYIGNDYAATLSSLAERQAVFFGRSSGCENPVLVRLNDRSDFLRLHRPQTI